MGYLSIENANNDNYNMIKNPTLPPLPSFSSPNAKPIFFSISPKISSCFAIENKSSCQLKMCALNILTTKTYIETIVDFESIYTLVNVCAVRAYITFCAWLFMQIASKNSVHVYEV